MMRNFYFYNWFIFFTKLSFFFFKKINPFVKIWYKNYINNFFSKKLKKRNSGLFFYNLINKTYFSFFNLNYKNFFFNFLNKNNRFFFIFLNNLFLYLFYFNNLSFNYYYSYFQTHFYLFSTKILLNQNKPSNKSSLFLILNTKFL